MRLLLSSNAQIALIICAYLPVLVMQDARADEGLWTFDSPPTKVMQSRYGFTPSVEWLDALRLSAVRLGGGSGAFVSADGLVLTNHHVARSCLQALSTADADVLRNGFHARTRAEERICPGLELRRLESTEDVTDKVRLGVSSIDDTHTTTERNVTIATLERECREKTGLQCEMVTLYRGAAYYLYRYRVWNDVRLLFAPENRLGEFGGDPDNFVFPRFALDFSLVRVYENGKPVTPTHFLKWAKQGVRDGDLVFSAGHPGTTARLLTLAQLVYERDVRYPMILGSLARARRVLQDYATRSPESARRAHDRLVATENYLKSLTGAYKALKGTEVMAAKTEEEARMRKSFTPAADQLDPWAMIEVATQNGARDAKSRWVVGYGFATLFRAAGEIVELASESALNEAERMAEYRASKLPGLVHRLSADIPFYKDLEIVRLAGIWQEAVDLLGKDHPFVVRVLGDKTPLAAATDVIEGSQIDQLAVRKKLIEGGLSAVTASTDPLIRLARDVYPMHRRLEKRYEVEVETPSLKAGDELEKIRFKLYAKDGYPDATFSLRLTFGKVVGYDADGTLIPFQTNWAGLYARSFAFNEQPPFDLPPRWLEKQRDLEPGTPLNFVSTLDISGGSSGSPVVNRDGELVGLIFDSNLEGLGRRFVYTERTARAIAVDVRAIAEALTKVYGADSVAAEFAGR